MSYLAVLQAHYRPAGDTGRADTTELAPAAAVYLPIVRKGESQKGQPPPKLLDAELSDEWIVHRARGVLNQDWLEQLDRTTKPGMRSAHFGFGINNNGSIRDANRSPVVTDAQMTALLEHCRTRLAELGGRIAAGDIAVSPYELNGQSPCDYCEFLSLCRFDPLSDNCRTLANYDKAEVLRRIT